MRHRTCPILFLLLCTPAWATVFVVMRTAGAANVFSGDPNCEAVWLLENGALTTDSTGNGNTLTNDGVVATTTHMEGSYAGDWEATETDSLLRADADLSSDFPLKSGGTQTDISVCFWVHFESIGTNYMVSKYDDSGSYRSFGVFVTSAYNKIGVVIGTSSGASSAIKYSSDVVTTGTWYHVAVTYQASTRNYTLRIWDDTAGSVLCNDSGTYASDMSITTASWILGARNAGVTACLDGLLDEVCVFNDILSTTDIDNIRSGLYSVGSGGGSSRRRVIVAQ